MKDAPAAPTSPWWRWLGSLAGLLAFAYFAYVLSKEWAHLPPERLNQVLLVGAGVAMVLYMGQLILVGLSWRVLLGFAGLEISRKTAVWIFGVSQMAKYLPGNVMQWVGRVGMAKALGYPAIPVSVTLLWEAAWELTMAVAIGLVLAHELLDLGLWRWAFLAGAAVVFFLPWVLSNRTQRSATPFVTLRWFRQLEGWHVSLQGTLACLFWYALSFLLMGIGLAAISPLAWSEWSSHLGPITCAVALAWALGYVLPGAPAGLGAREFVLLTLLTPLFGQSEAALMALVHRLATMAGDGLFFLIGVFLWNQIAAKPSAVKR